MRNAAIPFFLIYLIMLKVSYHREKLFCSQLNCFFI